MMRQKSVFPPYLFLFRMLLYIQQSHKLCTKKHTKKAQWKITHVPYRSLSQSIYKRVITDQMVVAGFRPLNPRTIYDCFSFVSAWIWRALRQAFDFIHITHIWQLNYVSLIGSACPSALQCTNMCLLNPEDNLQTLLQTTQVLLAGKWDRLT